jgi:hypothetical protein
MNLGEQLHFPMRVAASPAGTGVPRLPIYNIISLHGHRQLTRPCKLNEYQRHDLDAPSQHII